PNRRIASKRQRNTGPGGIRPVVLGLLIALTLAASAIRFSGISRKFYWIDEVSSSFVITGNWPSRIEPRLEQQDGKVVHVSSLLEGLEAKHQEGAGDLMKSLSQDDPHHCPLYFLVAQKWAALFGSKPSSLRALASLFGALSVPAFGWLA